MSARLAVDELPIHPCARDQGVANADTERVAAAFHQVQQAISGNDPVLSQKVRVVVDPRDNLHWFIHFRGLDSAPPGHFIGAPLGTFVGGLYGHLQFCPVKRASKNSATSFPADAPAFGILTPTGLFTPTTGAKDVGLPGICGTSFADGKEYKLSMLNSFDGSPIQVGQEYQTGSTTTAFGESMGRPGPTTVTVIDEDTLRVDSQMYGRYELPRYRGSFVKWLRALVSRLELIGTDSFAPLGDGFHGAAVRWWTREPSPRTAKMAQSIADAAASSADWATTAYDGQLARLFGDTAPAAATAEEPVLYDHTLASSQWINACADTRHPHIVLPFTAPTMPIGQSTWSGACKLVLDALARHYGSLTAAWQQGWRWAARPRPSDHAHDHQWWPPRAMISTCSLSNVRGVLALSSGAASSLLAKLERDARESTVIAECLDEPAPVAEGMLAVGAAADDDAHATVELATQAWATAVKVDPDTFPSAPSSAEIRRGEVLSVPRAVAQAVLVANGSLQAPRRRARTEPLDGDEMPLASRPRRSALGPTWQQPGVRVSYVFTQNGHDVAIAGTITEVHVASRRCTVHFDDGDVTCVDMAKMARI